jgi:hypothetical protein
MPLSAPVRSGALVVCSDKVRRAQVDGTIVRTADHAHKWGAVVVEKSCDVAAKNSGAGTKAMVHQIRSGDAVTSQPDPGPGGVSIQRATGHVTGRGRTAASLGLAPWLARWSRAVAASRDLRWRKTGATPARRTLFDVSGGEVSWVTHCRDCVRSYGRCSLQRTTGTAQCGDSATVRRRPCGLIAPEPCRPVLLRTSFLSVFKSVAGTWTEQDNYGTTKIG